MRLFWILLASFIGLLTWTLLGPGSRAAEDADVAGDFGEPIPGLTAIQSLQFKRGRAVFVKRFAREDGLGPHFNATSCTACHEDPVAGGSAKRYRDFFLVGRTGENGAVVKAYPDCTAENAATADEELCLPSLVIPNYGPRGTIAEPVAADVEHAPIPADADVVARRNAPPIFGIGLFRLVSDEEILSRSDPGDEDGDGISGRPNIIPTEGNAIGRFGYKAQTASIEAFNRGAFQNQLGITSNSIEFAAHAPLEEESALESLFRMKTAHAQLAEPRDRIVDYDGVFDPEILRGDLVDLVFFQEHLAAPRRGPITAAVLRGEAVFAAIGCTDCHTPSIETSIGLIHPYSDLLLHDLGPENADGVTMALATASEFRTQPLWGLCQHAPFLHDGSADALSAAILRHGGEAQAARDRYAALSAGEREDLHRFLESL